MGRGLTAANVCAAPARAIALENFILADQIDSTEYPSFLNSCVRLAIFLRRQHIFIYMICLNVLVNTELLGKWQTTSSPIHSYH